MVSSKERLRWERLFSAVTERMERQHAALTRLLAVNTEATAALLEIAHMEVLEDVPSDSAPQDRAREAIERMATMPVAIAESVAESDQKFNDDMKEATDGDH